jgi:transposase-like protein
MSGSCFQALIATERQKLVVLASDIVEYGLSPIDRLLVIKKGRGFTVVEGNRRLAAGPSGPRLNLPPSPPSEWSLSLMTKDDVLFGYRLQLFAEAQRTNVSAACRTFGVHRSTYYAWKRQVDRHGLQMLRQQPSMCCSDGIATGSLRGTRRPANPCVRRLRLRRRDRREGA